MAYRPELAKLLGVRFPMEELLDAAKSNGVTFRRLSRDNVQGFIERELI